MVHFNHGRLTQLVECHLDMVKAVGSSPIPTTIRKIRDFRLFFVFLETFSLNMRYIWCRDLARGESTMDRKLKKAIESGDHAAFRKLYDEYSGMALRTAYGITRNHEMAADAVQEAFLRVYRGIRSFDTERHFGPWLHRIVVNECMRQLSSSGEYLQLNEEIVSDKNEDAFTGNESLKEALWNLEPHYRAAVILKYLLGYKEKEIAVILGISKSAVKSRLYKGRNMLKETIEAGGAYER